LSDIQKILDGAVSYLKYKEKYSPIELYNTDVKESEESFEIAAEEEESMPKKTVSQAPASKVADDGTLIREGAGTYIFSQEDWMKSKTLEELREAIKDCQKCDLWKTRNNFVFGTGNPNADVVCVGEAPGAEEDKQGKPFVGRAGQLLTKILQAINFEREDVFIANILKSRPPDNRNPLPYEIEQCEPYLVKQLEIIKPKLILALGTFASQTLLKTKEPLGKLRGKFHLYNGIKMMVTYHPAALLRNPHWKKPAWEDVQLLRAEYDKMMKEKK
jgi:uracil-DNA glycosylase